MSWLTAYALGGLFSVLLLGGMIAAACAAVTFQDARTGDLGDDWHRREFRRAYRWFALCAGCWLGVALLWLAVR